MDRSPPIYDYSRKRSVWSEVTRLSYTVCWLDYARHRRQTIPSSTEMQFTKNINLATLVSKMSKREKKTSTPL